MFTSFNLAKRCMQRAAPLTRNTLQTLTAAISSTSAMLKDMDDEMPAQPMSNLPHSPVVDIDVEKMMYEDEELGALFRMPSDERDENDEDGDDEPKLTKTLDQDGIPLAPVDIDPWVEEEEAKQGTVEVERCVNPNPPIEYPPIPPASDRSGTYQFKGIKVVLPKRMLTPSTFRYRLDPEDQDLADDMRICRYDK